MDTHVCESCRAQKRGEGEAKQQRMVEISAKIGRWAAFGALGLAVGLLLLLLLRPGFSLSGSPYVFVTAPGAALGAIGVLCALGALFPGEVQNPIDDLHREALPHELPKELSRNKWHIR